MSPRRRICCIISSLGVGGAERVMSLLASEWAAQREDVTIVTLTATGRDAYPLNKRVQRIGLDLERESWSPLHAIAQNLRRIRALRGVIKRLAPHVVVSFVDKSNVLTLLSSRGLGVPVIVAERTHPPYHTIGRIWSFLRWLTYRFANAIVVQSEVTRGWAKRLTPRVPVYVIANPLGSQFFAELPAVGTREPVVLAVGRFGPEKGFDLLIEAFARLAVKHPDWSLVVVGAGPLDGHLKDLAGRLLPRAAFSFPGAVSDPERYYRAASIFAVSSHYEGFPNALLEAMASGCAVVASKCPGGIAEIIRPDIDGVLVPPGDVASLATQIDRLMNNPSERARLGDNAARGSVRFRMDRIRSLWEKVTADVGRRETQNA